jgi:hypothetical protein
VNSELLWRNASLRQSTTKTQDELQEKEPT